LNTDSHLIRIYAPALKELEIQDLKSRLAQKTSECEILKEVQTKKFMTSEAYSNMISIFDSALTEVAKKTIQKSSQASNQTSGSTSSIYNNSKDSDVLEISEKSYQNVATQTNENLETSNLDSEMDESIESAENIEIISIREADISPEKTQENSSILPQNLFNSNISNGTATMIAEITDFPADISADSTVKSEPNSDAFNQPQTNQVSRLGYQNLLQTQSQMQSFTMNLGQINQSENHKNSSDIKQEEGYLAIQQKKTQRLSMLKQRNAEGYFECHLCPYKSTYRIRSN